MTNSDTAIREFAETIYDTMNPVIRGDKKMEVDYIISDLTALISKHYYPKEFTEWAIGLGRSDFDDRYYHYISVQNPNMPFKETKELEFDDLDDAFNYWKENER